jgi:putative membrane-bound dehydrogenase-like protein
LLVLFLALVPLLVPGALHAQGYSPADAIKQFQVPEGFKITCVASEPDVRKPVTITFDDRGRMWVIQYLQYPSPAGLKPIKVDQYLRTVYDRVPEPPPKGPKGADRITILEDPDETGRYRKIKDFHVGLNLASGMCLGYGGVFVAQPPYLLFYKIKEGVDVPDGDPEVLLSGFGMEDAHAFANSLQWGPDGWLYGAQGSTVTANIRGIEFQQGIWRYHPVTKEFELFAEGGGNTWGLDFDRHGQIIAGTNWGGQAMLHQVQGGYYVKGFTKHGPLHNPYTFGYFDHVPYTGFKGGHVTCGGILYTGGLFPEKYHNQYIAANLLSNAIYWHQLERNGSSFKAKFGGDLVTTDDKSFRPVDCLVGPDGAVYIADWCDKRANHVDPVDNWDRTKGRIYKLDYPANRQRKLPGDAPLSKLSSKELVALLSQPNDWYCREARRILAERRDASVIPTLKQMVLDKKDQLALESLWALYVSGGFDDELALKLLDHPNEHVRTWTVRLLCDPKRRLKSTVVVKLELLAEGDPSPVVRSQLACSAKRLPADQSLGLAAALLTRSEDADDPHVPLLIWWAIEKHGGSIEQVKAKARPMFDRFILERMARRYVAEGSFRSVQELLEREHRFGTKEGVRRLLAGIEKGLEGRRLEKKDADDLASTLERMWQTEGENPDPNLFRISLRLGLKQAEHRAKEILARPQGSGDEFVATVELLGQLGKAEHLPTFLRILREYQDTKVRQALLTALQSFPQPEAAQTVLEVYPKLQVSLKSRAQGLLCSRPASALDFLKAVDAKKIDPKEVPLDNLQRLVAFKNSEIDKLVEKHWGKVGAQSSGEKQSRMASIKHILRQGKGDAAKGKELFVKNCANCHTLFNEGNKVGPELTGLDRKNLDFLVVSIVDPSAFIRPEFVAYNVVKKDGQVLTGLLAEDSPKTVTLLDAQNQRTVIAKDKVEEMTASAQSLMPEKLLDPFDDQQIRDFFAYLQSEPATKNSSPPPAPRK